MTVIIGAINNGKVHMAADSLGTCGSIKEYITNNDDAKIVRCGKKIVALAGNVATIKIMVRAIKNFKDEALNKALILNSIMPRYFEYLKELGYDVNSEYDDCSDHFPYMLIAEGKKLYTVTNKVIIRNYTGSALGSGALYIKPYILAANASDDPKGVLEEGVLYAESKVEGVGGDVYYMNTRDLNMEVRHVNSL